MVRKIVSFGSSGREDKTRLRRLTLSFGFSLALGDMLYIEDCWYMTNAGLRFLVSVYGCATRE